MGGGRTPLLVKLAWKRLRSRPVGSYRIFDVRSVDIERRPRDGSAGGDVVEAFVLDCPEWCNVVPITDDGHVVMIRQYRFGADRETLEVPGGLCEPGEEPSETAQRELREETGYVASRVEPLGTISPNPAIQSNTCHVFVAHGCRRVAETAFDEHEDIAVELVPIDEVRRMLARGAFEHALVHVALSMLFLRGLPRFACAETPRDEELVSLFERLVDQQEKKVLALARRLRGDLTPDDVKNPHDFQELSDPDFQFEDGVLAGYQGALMALRAELQKAQKEK